MLTAGTAMAGQTPPGVEPLHAGEDHGGGSAGGGHEPAAEREDEEIDEGNFFPAGDAPAGVFGYVKLIRFDEGTEGTLHAGGLKPGARYESHLHEGTCFEHGPHYRHDKDGPAGPPNELWFSGDPADPHAGLQADGDGCWTGLASWNGRPAEKPARWFSMTVKPVT